MWRSEDGLKYWSSPHTAWFLRLKSYGQVQRQVPLPAAPSHQPILPNLKNSYHRHSSGYKKQGLQPRIQLCGNLRNSLLHLLHLSTVHCTMQEMLGGNAELNTHSRESGETRKAHLHWPPRKQPHFYRDAGKRQYQVSGSYSFSSVYKETD